MAIPTNYVHEPRIVFFAVAFTNTEYRRTTCDIFYGFLYTIHTHSPSSTVEPVSLAGKDILAVRL
jgi:hypothetical protein